MARKVIPLHRRSGKEVVKLADVAEAAGVSLATASRALSDATGVSEKTRIKVKKAAERLAYVVSPEASRLAGGRTGRVAVVVPHLSRWFFGELLEGLVAVTSGADLDLILYHVDGIDDRRDFFERLPARRKVDAVVVLAFPVDEEERCRLQLMGVDIVAAGGQDAPYPHVYIDDLAAGRRAVDHLIMLGHRRIAMIEATDPDQPVQPCGRSQAYFAALAEAAIPLDDQLIVSVSWSAEHGADAMNQLLSLRRPPTAVYAHSDELALGAMRSIRRAGLRIPDDISIVGIDDHPQAAIADLTTVRQPVREQGRLAGEILIKLLAGEKVPNRIEVPTNLVVRTSASRLTNSVDMGLPDIALQERDQAPVPQE